MTSEPLPQPERIADDHSDDLSPGARATVRRLRESWAVVAPHEHEVVKLFYAVLFSIAPDTRDLFAANMEAQRTRLLRALVHFVQRVDRPDELLPFLRQLGRDHRKFGVVAHHYDAVGTALIASIKNYAGDAWTESVENAWAEAYAVMAAMMTKAAASDPGPAWYEGEVVQHHQLSSDLAVVRVRSDPPIPYEAGQYVSVEVPQRPRLWRYFSPANAPNPAGLLEFHVREVPQGWVSGAIVRTTKVGDRWRLSAPMGRMPLERNDLKLLMVAGGTGLSPMRSILQKLIRCGYDSRVDLFYGGRTREHLYGLDGLQRLAGNYPWLHVTPVLEAGAQESAGIAHGTLADAITRRGRWGQHKVLVAGSPTMIRATVSRLLVSGVPLDHIRYDPFRID
jgi:NAD(P)H-flavin reductase/hemoglobin-like flavoprotein